MKRTSTKPKTATRYSETAFGIISRSRLVELEAEGVAKGLVWIINTFPKRPAITVEFLLFLHEHCFGFIFPEWAGKLRKVPVQVSEYVPPPPHQLRELLTTFEQDLAMQLKQAPINKAEQMGEIIRIAAWMQHQIVWIHPFLDYNGRIARLVTNLLFLEYGLPLVEIPAEKRGNIRRQYVVAMQSGDKGDLRPLEQLLHKALKEETKAFGK